MNGHDDSRSPPCRIDEAAKAAFLAALRRGARREDAAAEAGFSLTGFYGARARDPAFAAAWRAALGEGPAAGRRARAYAERGERLARGEVRIHAANRRVYQRRRRAHVRFDADAQDAFLAGFAASCDTKAAAAAAGVSESTVHRHRRLDRGFAEAYAAALAQGYELLEAEAVRQRLAAQARLRAAAERADEAAPAPSCPHCGRSDDAGAEFDRIMRLLARWDRRPRRPDSRFTPGGRRQRVTFDQAIAMLDKHLRALGVRTTTAPPSGD